MFLGVKIMKKTIVLLLTILSLSACDPTTYILKGNVRNNNQNIHDAKVTLHCPDDKTQKVTETNKEGAFLLTCSKLPPNCFLLVEHPGYEKTKIDIDPHEFNNNEYTRQINEIYVRLKSR